ncbi:MAG: hypothetical protein WDA14_03345 [Sphaerochaetaceae bacterium]|jgi:hypothetical protein
MERCRGKSAITDALKLVDTFLNDPHQHVFLLLGIYGIGKRDGVRELLNKYDTRIIEHGYVSGEAEIIRNKIDKFNSSIHLWDDVFASCLLDKKVIKLFNSLSNNTIEFSGKFILIANDAEFHDKPIPNLPGAWIQVPNKFMDYSKY